MPNLLSINSYHYRRGGSDAVYFDHAALMEELGWRNSFFSMHHPKNFDTPWSKYFIDELEFGQGYSLAQKLRMAAKVVYSLEAQRKLRQLLRDHRADIAHLHCIYHHHSPSILPVLREHGVPVVLTAHDLKIACPAYKMLNSGGVCERCKTGSVLNVVKHRCVRDSLAASAIVAVESAVHGLHGVLDSYRKHVSRVVAPSRFYRDKLLEWGWNPGQVTYIPNYVDASRFEPAFEPGDYLLYFGRLAPEKGVDTLLRAAAQAGVRLRLAGTGPDEAALHALNAQLGGRAEFLGYQAGAALHTLVRGARAVVLPSQWYENAPMSVLESFAMGKPVVGSRMGGITEMIEEGGNGWLFDSGRADALAAVLSTVKAMPDAQLAGMGRAARACVEDRFNRSGYVAAMLGLYEELGVRG